MASRFSDQKLRDFLLAQSPVWLTEQLLSAATTNSALLATLHVAAAGSDRIQLVRRELDRAIWVADFIEWQDVATYVYDVERALGLLADLIRDGYPDDAIELAEHAMDLLQQSAEQVHDDGEMHGCLVYAQEIHLRACLAGRPDPTALAQQLFIRATTADDWGIFRDVVAAYAQALGPTGVARLRSLIDDEVGRLPQLGIGQTASLAQSMILHLAQQAAKADGVDAVVDVLARDLSSAARFEQICQELITAERVEQALDWALRGLAELQKSPERIDHGSAKLRRLAASLHAQLGQPGAAVDLAWQDFVPAPSVESYQRLREYGKADGSWPQWRERALDELRRQPPLPTPPPPTNGYGWSPAVGHSVLVNVLLEEGDVAAAWQAAHDGSCLEGVWLTLTRQRAEQHPQDALPVFRRHIETAVDNTKRDAYQHAVSLLTEVREYYERAGAAAEFAEYVQRLRAAHRRKRNFIAALDTARLPA